MIEEPFHCEKPVDAFKMKWAPNTSKDASRWLVTKPGQKVDLQVWNGFIGSPAPINVGKGNQPGPGIFCDVSPDEVVSVSGLNSGSKKSADVQYWEVFDADPKCAVSGPNGIKIGNSAFNIGCEKDMKDQTDCGKPEGDLKIEKGQTNLINDWLLAGITGKKGSLQCDGSGLSGDVQQNCTIAQPGDNVFYQYKVTNNGKADVNVTVTDDKKTTGPVGTFKIPGKDTVPAGSNIHTFTWGPVAINSTTVNVGTAIGNAGSNECKVTDKVIVTTPCFLGDPRNGTLYPYGTLPSRTAVIFNESEALQRLEPSVATLGQTIRMWYTDEHAMLLGVNTVQTRNKDGTTSTKTAPVTPYDSTKLADSVINPATGVPEKDGGTDPAGRPIAPSLFCTDITADPLSTAGDWQMMGTAQGPQFVSGTWKGANVLIDPAAARNNGSSRVITTAPDPARNGVTLGPGADPLPAGLRNQGYVSEVRWDVSTMQCVNPATHQLESLKPGHSYRMQFMVHDGDQNKSGGDVGEACSTVTIPD